MRNKVQYKMISQSSRIYSNHKYMWIYFRVPKYIKQITTYLKGEIHSNTIIADNFSTPLSAIDRQKIKKETLDLNIGLHGSTCFYRTSHPIEREYTFF